MRLIQSKKNKLIFILTFSLFILFVTPFFGVTKLEFLSLFLLSSDQSNTIFWQLRVPRSLCAFIVGGSLSVSGLLCQALLKNPLATPFTLGISSGAALFSVTYILLLSYFPSLAYINNVFFSFTGALITSILILKISTLIRSKSIDTDLLLSGIAISFLFSNLIVLFQYLGDMSSVFKITKWLLGGILVINYKDLIILTGLLLPFVFIIYSIAWKIDLISVGYEFAETHGVDFRKTTRILFILNSILVGAVISFCGPIGFIGILEPYLSKSLFGNLHKYIIPSSFMMGGAFLTLCDTFSRTISPPIEIPVGVMTGLIGGPFFVYILIYREKRR